MKKSRLSVSLKDELFLSHKKMTPEERLNAFFIHSQLLMRLFAAGRIYRKGNTPGKILLNSRKKKSK